MVMVLPIGIVAAEELLRRASVPRTTTRAAVVQVVVGDEAAALGVEEVHRRVGRRDAHDVARLLDRCGSGRVMFSLRNGRDEIDLLRLALAAPSRRRR